MLQDHLVSLDPKAHLEILEKMVYLDSRVILEEMECLVPKVMQDPEVTQAHQVSEVCLGSLAKKEREELLGLQVLLAHRDHRVNWDPLG